MEIVHNINIRNEFLIRILDAETGKVKQEAKAYNTVTEYALKELSRGSGPFTMICYGSGTGTPSMTDTELFNRLNQYSATLVESVMEGDIYKEVKTIRIPADVSVGANITEVGFRQTTGNNTLGTHALITDSEGAPIAINKTATDIIDIYATIYAELSFGEFHDNLSVVKYNYDHTHRLDNPFIPRLLRGMLNGMTSMDYIAVGRDYSRGNIGDIISDPQPRTSQYLYFSPTKSFNQTAFTVTLKMRFTEDLVNTRIAAISLPGDVLLKLPAPGIYEGTTFVGESLGIGDGVNKLFDTVNTLPKDMILYNNGSVIPKESYSVRNTYVDLTRGPDVAHRLRELVDVYNYAQHPTYKNRFVGVNSKTNELVFISINENLDVIIDGRFPIPAADAVIADSLGYLLEGRALAVGKSIYSYEESSNSISTKWTRHPNMPGEYSGVTTTRMYDIGGPFALAAKFGNTNRDDQFIYTFSMDETTHTFGEYINLVPSPPSTDFINYIRVRGNRVAVINYNSNAQVFEIDVQTGLIGIPISIPSYTEIAWYGDNKLWAKYRYATTYRLIEFDYANGTSAILKEVSKSSYGILLYDNDNICIYSTVNYEYNHIIYKKVNNDLEVARTMAVTDSSLYKATNYSQMFDIGDMVLVRFAYADSTNSANGGSSPVLIKRLGVREDNRIEFVAPPAEGAVITADYRVDYIPKTSNHVLDISVTYALSGS